MKKRFIVLYALLVVILVILALSHATSSPSFAWQPSPAKNPIARAYQKLSLGMEEKKVYALMQEHAATELVDVQTYEQLKAAHEERLARGGVPEWEKPPEVGVSYADWLWYGDPLDPKVKLPALLAPADYEERSQLAIQFKDGKVRDAVYIYYRYLYRSSHDECRTRGFYYSKIECLAPDDYCPHETRYENLKPCK